MVALFVRILDMSVTGSVLILLVLAARVALRKSPRIFSYILWLVVLARLLFPVSILIQVDGAPDSGNLVETLAKTNLGETARFYSGSEEYARALENGDLSQIYAAEGESYVILAADGLDAPDTVETALFPFLSVLWVLGGAAVLLYGALSALGLRRRLVGAVHVEGNLYLADHIAAPFVLGLLRPRIYLPSDLREGERAYILAHERHHIRRGDHVVKLLAFAAAAVHWFNPLVWLACHLLGRDMEMSCDEAVLRRFGPGIRCDYSQSLLDLATGRHWAAWTPLSFGEGNTGGRIRHVLSWRKPTALTLAAAILLTTALSVCAVTELIPREESQPASTESVLPLNSTQLAALEELLTDVSLREVSVNPYGAMQSLFAVRLETYSLRYCYHNGRAYVLLATEQADYLLDNEALREYLYHVYIARGTVDMRLEEVPENTHCHHEDHAQGCNVRFYDYYCTACGQQETAVVSYYCGCGNCKDYWREVGDEVLARRYT